MAIGESSSAREAFRGPKSRAPCPYNSGDSKFDHSELDRNDWSDNEKSKFVRAVRIHGKNFTMISRYLGTKSIEECKIYFSKAQRVLNLDMIAVESELEGDDWSDRDKSKFVQALSIYGKNFTMISRYIGTRSIEECITFFAKTRGAGVAGRINMATMEATMAINEDYFDADIDSTFAAIRPGLR
uniref:SANT domain-containing protein n=1 Tax=Leersia perrieri TaxID=77586 RepID=A0A0D9XX40_9ORYZ